MFLKVYSQIKRVKMNYIKDNTCDLQILTEYGYDITNPQHIKLGSLKQECSKSKYLKELNDEFDKKLMDTKQQFLTNPQHFFNRGKN